MTSNRRVVLASRPVGAPRESDLRFENAEIPALREGELLLEAQWLSLDPYMRGRMSDDKSYAQPIPIGGVMVGRTIGLVAASRHPRFAVGDTVLATSGWQTHFVSDGSGLRKLDAGLSRPSLALGVLGNSGLAAWVGLMRVARLQAGETLAIAAATGPVGATAVQLAKMQGARVIAIAGGAEKVTYAREVLGADEALDHRAPDFAERLAAAAGPGGVDVYFENVGGEVLHAVLPHLNDRARLAICGLIAWYNLAGPPAGPDHSPALMRTILRKRLRVEGFVLTDWADEHDAFVARMSQWLAEGRIAFREHVVERFEDAPRAFIGLLEGRSFGKTIVRMTA